ncbi:MAG: hypothetical protein A2V93_04885 [Ignavibacteria bacterium RBG_16_34_14]|nr:MAG: hypothetical protein A2V93_04885 [Ignavibacteria bacterium RBG_16_34_14]
MKNFKKLFLVIFLIIAFLINGCYTILWTPDEDFPDESNYESYDTYYVDDYYYFYDYPWWLSFTPPTKSGSDNSYERDNSMSKIRNNGNGRGDSGREILVTPPPTRNYTPTDNGSDDTSGNNNTNTETKRTESVNSNNSRQDSNSNNNSTRNNDGSRNNGRSR